MINQESSIDAVAAFTNYLEAKKLRKTPERFAILAKVWNMHTHFDVDELYQALENDAYHVSRATVYNTVDLLCECGLVRKHQFESQHAQYEVAIGNHMHLICTQCGKIKDVKDDEFLLQITRRKYNAFTPLYNCTYVYGLCSACVRQNKKQKNK